MMCAPPDVSCIRGVNAGRMVFGVRACGDWSKAVNRWAWTAAGVTTNDGTVDEVSIDGEKQKVNKVTNPASTSAQIIDKSQPMWINHPPPHLRARVHAMLDGPYGGCSVRVEEYESVLFVSGGSGITFVMGVLDGLVGRCLGRGKNIGEVRTRRVEVVWCVRSFGMYHYLICLFLLIVYWLTIELCRRYPLVLSFPRRYRPRSTTHRTTPRPALLYLCHLSVRPRSRSEHSKLRRPHRTTDMHANCERFTRTACVWKRRGGVQRRCGARIDGKAD